MDDDGVCAPHHHANNIWRKLTTTTISLGLYNLYRQTWEFLYVELYMDSYLPSVSILEPRELEQVYLQCSSSETQKVRRLKLSHDTVPTTNDIKPPKLTSHWPNTVPTFFPRQAPLTSHRPDSAKAVRKR